MEREVTGYPGLSVEEDSVDDLCLSSEDDKKRITGVILGEERERESTCMCIILLFRLREDGPLFLCCCGNRNIP